MLLENLFVLMLMVKLSCNTIKRGPIVKLALYLHRDQLLKEIRRHIFNSQMDYPLLGMRKYSVRRYNFTSRH